MNFDLFDSPELLDIQREGFYHFLNEGIENLLAKQFPIRVKSGSYSIELRLNEQNIKLIAPDSSPRDCILNMKTYSCKLYAQVNIICKKRSSINFKKSGNFLPKVCYANPFFTPYKPQNKVFKNFSTISLSPWLHQRCKVPRFTTLSSFARSYTVHLWCRGVKCNSNLKTSFLNLYMHRLNTGKTNKKIQTPMHQKCREKLRFASLYLAKAKSRNKVHSKFRFSETKESTSEAIVYQSLPEWVLLGQLPMMTKRGHFIINGSPRVIVHQVVRAPGIYFQKLIKKEEQNFARFYGDIIPLKGVWVRLQMTKKGRIEAKFKKGKKVQVEFLQKCLQVIEDQMSVFDEILFDAPKVHKPNTNKSELHVIAPPGKRVKKDFKKFLTFDLTAPTVLQRKCTERIKTSEEALKKKFLDFETSFDDNKPLLIHPSLNARHLSSVSPSVQKFCFHTSNFNVLYEDYSTLLEKKKSRASSKAEHDAFIQTYDKLYRTTQDKELEEWQKKKSHLSFFKGLSPENAFKRKKCSENLFSSFKIPARYDLGLLGREKINDKFGLVRNCNALLHFEEYTSGVKRGYTKNIKCKSAYKYKHKSSHKSSHKHKSKICEKICACACEKICKKTCTCKRANQLTALDISSATVWLYKLRRGEKCTDDIDHFQNRRVRTSGELLQTQFENGLERLKNLLSTKLQEWRTSFSPSTFSSIFKERYKTRYNEKYLFKTSRQHSLAASTIREICVIRDFTFLNASLQFDRRCKSANPVQKFCLNKTKKSSWQNYYKISVKEVFSTKPITGALREFFGSNPLSQYMDQTNPLAEITHKRRISSLGVGGVSRDSAGMAIRGIHPTHYGRICPIETPEGKNAGLVNSLAFYTKVDINGFLKTPYYRVVKGQIQPSLGFSFTSAEEESLTGLSIAPSDLQKSSNNILRTKDTLLEAVPVRVTDNQLDVFKKESPYKVKFIGISPIQMISVATSLIPFLEHNDANRALMGSNMQRQAVPLMISERPIVGTGLESIVIVESGHITESQVSGFASQVTANKIIIDRLCCIEKNSINFRKIDNALKTKFLGSTSLHFDSKCNTTQKFFSQSYAYLSNSKLYSANDDGVWRRKDILHLQPKSKTKYKVCTFGAFFGCTSFTAARGYTVHLWCRGVKCKSNANVLRAQNKASFLVSSVNSLTTFSRSNQNTCITEKPLIQQFDWVQKGDVLSDCSASNNGELAVGKNVLVAYIPWEGYNFEDAIVINERLVRSHVYTSLHIERYTFQAQDLKDGNEWFTKHLPGIPDRLVEHLEESGLPKIGSFLKEGSILVGKIRYLNKKPSSPYERLLCDILGEKNFAARNKSLYVPKGVEARVIYHRVINQFDNEPENQVRPPKAARTVNIFLGEKRVIQVGDKISGRHGNKGVISTILPRQDMPYLPDGTPIDIILNPLGVPSRMNVGQVLECLLGLAADYLNQHFKMTAFDERYGVEASKSIVFLKLYQARLQSGQNWLFQVNFPGKTRLVDGRSGLCFDQWITVGKAYILKLIHMVTEKIHARSTGPYALITQQPLRGRSNKGGQRLGEMEVWALEGFGAAYTLQELLTKKSDDFFGRKQIVDSILPNPSSIVDTLQPNFRIHQSRPVLGHPEIFKVLLCELQALCLDLGVYIVTPESFKRSFLGVVH